MDIDSIRLCSSYWQAALGVGLDGLPCTADSGSGLIDCGAISSLSRFMDLADTSHRGCLQLPWNFIRVHFRLYGRARSRGWIGGTSHGSGTLSRQGAVDSLSLDVLGQRAAGLGQADNGTQEPQGSGISELHI